MKFRLMAALGLLLMLPVDPVFAQSTRTASSRTQDLWGIWREGFTHYEKAEKARVAKRYEEALQDSWRYDKNLWVDWEKEEPRYQ